MFQSEYRRELEQLGPGQQELERLYTAIDEGGTDMKYAIRIGRRAAMVLAVCAALLITATAAGPTMWKTLQTRLGPFAPYAQDIEGASCTDQGLEVKMLSSLLDDVRGQAFFTIQDVSGDRLNEFLKLNGTLTAGEAVEPKEPTGSIGAVGTVSTGVFQLVSYDPETKTALMAANILYGESSQPIHEAQLTITGMSTTRGEMGGSVSCEAVTGMTLDSLPVTGENQVVKSLGVSDDFMYGQNVVLAPGQNPMPIDGTEDMSISSIGFASDGCFHVRLEFAEGVQIKWDQGGSTFLSDLMIGDGTSYGEKNYSSQEIAVEGGVDICFPLVHVEDLEQLSQVRFSGNYTRPGETIEGSWSIGFQMEYHPSVTLGWTGELAGRQIRQVTVSPLTVTMYSNDWGGFNSSPVYAVLKDGSTVAAQGGIGRYSNVGEGTGEEIWSTYNTWQFETPVDLEQVTALELLGERIPVDLS